MNEQRKCLVGRDNDGWIWPIVIGIIVVAVIVSLVVYGGAFIGGFYSIKNYFVSLKHNVIDSNKPNAQTA